MIWTHIPGVWTRDMLLALPAEALYPGTSQRDDIAVHMAAERVTHIFKIQARACRSMHTGLPLYAYGCPVQTGPRAGAQMSVGRGSDEPGASLR